MTLMFFVELKVFPCFGRTFGSDFPSHVKPQGIFGVANGRLRAADSKHFVGGVCDGDAGVIADTSSREMLYDGVEVILGFLFPFTRYNAKEGVCILEYGEEGNFKLVRISFEERGIELRE